MKNQWGVVIGKPTKKWEEYKGTFFGEPNMSNVGTWCIDNGGHTLLFSTRAQARLNAHDLARANPWWHYHAKKFEEKK